MSSDYDPNERGRYDGDDDPVWGAVWSRGCCETSEQIGERLGNFWERYNSQFQADLPPDATAITCPICNGARMLPAENGTTCDCYHCGGHGRLT